MVKGESLTRVALQIMTLYFNGGDTGLHNLKNEEMWAI